MPEKGRPAASSGNAYQDVRVATCLIDLLEDVSVTSVAVETLDEIDDLVVRRAGRAVRYEQVKERAPSSGRWTAQRLSDEGVLRQFLRQHRVEPSGELVLFTGSDASDLREVVDRARNASGNHSNDELGRQAALTEWKRRLEGRHRFVEQILSRIATEDRQHTMTWQDLHQLLARVRVLDAQGTIDQLREREVQRLRHLVDDPTRAFNTLEQMAREAAICRGVIGRPDVEASLTRDGSGPRLAAFTLSINEGAYAHRIQRESAAVDVAKLPPLVPHFDSPSGLSFDLDEVRGRVLLVGGHGAGKSESPETGVGRDGPSSMPPQPEKPPRSRALLRPVTPARQAHAPTAPRASGVKSSTAGTPPSRPGRKAHNCSLSGGTAGVSSEGPERSGGRA